MRKIILIVIVGALFFSFDLSRSGVKKMDKTLAKLWPGKEIVKKPINISTSEKKISFKIEENTFYEITNTSNTVYYLFLSKAKGKMNVFDYMVVFNHDLSILKVKILVYREERGGEIGSNRWLKQFIGKSDPKKMKFGHDIQNISGATISARSLTEDVKNVTQKMIELRAKGFI